MENHYLEKYIETDRLRICYYDEGTSDRVLLLLHAFPLNKGMWLPQLKLAGEALRVVAPDLRGFGGTEAGEEEFSLRLFNRDLENFISALGLANPVLCGLSLGGYQALLAANLNAGRYKGFIFCSTQCIADSPEIRENRSAQIHQLKQEGLEKFAKDFLEKALAKPINRSLADFLLTLVNVNQVKPSVSVLLAISQRSETCNGVKGLMRPVLIVAGKADRIVPYTQSELLQTTIGGASIHLMENVGHFCNLENPVEFNAVCLRFIDKYFSL